MVDQDPTDRDRDEGSGEGDAPTLGNAVYRWADRILGPLPYGVRVTVVGLIVAFLVLLPLVLFVLLLDRA